MSPVAHLAVGFLTLGLLIPVMLWPPSAPLLLLPLLLSALIVRLRTVADDRGVTVRTLLDSRTVRWDDEPRATRPSFHPEQRGAHGHGFDC